LCTSLFFTYNQASSRYWLEPADLPDENVIFTEKHCEMINQITAAYDRYVQTGTIINETLVTEMKVYTHLTSLFSQLNLSNGQAVVMVFICLTICLSVMDVLWLNSAK